MHDVSRVETYRPNPCMYCTYVSRQPGSAAERTNGRTDGRRTDERTSERTNGRTDEGGAIPVGLAAEPAGIGELMAVGAG